MQAQAVQANHAYQADNGNPAEIRSIEEVERMTSFPMRDHFKSDALEFVLPKFFIREDTGNLFEGVTDLTVDRDMLSKNFTLADKDTVINFDNLPPAGQMRQCVAKIVAIIDKGKIPSKQEIISYVAKIVAAFERERIREAVQHSGVYAKKN